MVHQAMLLGYQGLGICDINGLYGVVRGWQAANKPSVFEANPFQDLYKNFRFLTGTELTPVDASPVALLPMNREGYSRLCRLITLSKRPAPKGFTALKLDDILESNEDLIALPLPPWNKEHLLQLQGAFQDRIYLPVCKDSTWEAITLYQQALRFERDLGLVLFATQRPLFHIPDRKPLFDVLTCILHKVRLSEATTLLTLNRERHLKSRAQISDLFRERPDLLDRTLEIADRVSFSLNELRYRYPQEYLPPGRTAHEFLRELTETGLRWRYPQGVPQEVQRLTENELALIKDLEYEDYFLTIWDICNFARQQGILHQGRGSAANSVVCYALGLTAVDVTRINLLFERFISKERDEPPDIDIDFEHERREEVIQYIYRKYGEARAAMVCTVICYRSRMAIREVAKVMGVEPRQIDALVRTMGREGISRLLEDSVQIASFGLSEQQFHWLLRLARELQGFPRHLGIHTGGFVVCQESVVDIVPVEKATMEGRYVIQWNKDDINILNMMKIDVLSLGMLTALRKSLDLLRQHKNIDWDLAEVPAEDPATYQMIQKADTVGVFQIESRAQMQILPRLKPAKYYDLVIEVAIVRPGPIKGGMLQPFLRRRQGLEKVRYPHPALEPILKRTWGVPIFQEQIMQIAVAAAGFTPGEADELRRLISSTWTRQLQLGAVRRRLIDGMIAKGISKNYAEQIYKVIEGFSSYGFPESHAASFALLSYSSSYMKCHHPDIFACALLNSQPMGFYSPRALIGDAQRHGVEFRALDVQTSAWDYTLEPPTQEERPNQRDQNPFVREPHLKPVHDLPPVQALHPVRVGFRSVHGLAEKQIAQLLETRAAGGPFRDLPDLLRRTELPRPVLSRIAAAGALNSMGLSARESLWLIQGLNDDPQSLFFGSLDADTDSLRQQLNLLPEESPWEEIQREYQTKGFAVDRHVLSTLRPALIKFSEELRKNGHLPFRAAQTIASLRHGTPVRVAGLLALMQKPPTAKGMCFLTLEDETGSFNIVVDPHVYQDCRLTLSQAPLVEVTGVFESRHGVHNIVARKIAALPLQFLFDHYPKAFNDSTLRTRLQQRTWR